MEVRKKIRIGFINQKGIKKINFHKFKYVVENIDSRIAKNNTVRKSNTNKIDKFSYPFNDEYIDIYEKASGLDIKSTEEIVRKLK